MGRCVRIRSVSWIYVLENQVSVMGRCVRIRSVSWVGILESGQHHGEMC